MNTAEFQIHLQPPRSKEDIALREDGQWVGCSLRLDDLPRGHLGGLFDINPDMPVADEERIRKILARFWNEGRCCIHTLGHRPSEFRALHLGVTEEEYTEKRLNAMFAGGRSSMAIELFGIPSSSGI